MSRLAAQAQALYYPTELRVIYGIARLLELQWPNSIDITSATSESAVKNTGNKQSTSAPALFRVIDPSAGTGRAVATLVQALLAKAKAAITSHTLDVVVELYGVELDANRAAECRQYMNQVLNTDAKTAKITDRSFDMVFCNPPYDQDNLGPDKRVEQSFLLKCTKILRPGGYLVWIVPRHVLEVNATVLASFYKDHIVRKFPYPERSRFDQVVVVAQRKSAKLPNANRAADIVKLARGEAEIKLLDCPTPEEFRDLIQDLESSHDIKGPEITAELQRLVSASTQSLMATEGSGDTATDDDTHNANTLNLYAVIESSGVPPKSRAIITPNPKQKNNSSGVIGNPITFAYGEYHLGEALIEANLGGIWSSKIRQELVHVPPRRAMIIKRPLMPLRIGMSSQFIQIGLANNMLLRNAWQKVVVKGQTLKKWKNVAVEHNEEGKQTKRIDKEIITSKINTLDLITGELTLLGAQGVGKLVQEFSASIQEQMLTNYPPLYIPLKPIRREAEVQAALDAITAEPNLQGRHNRQKRRRARAAARLVMLIERGMYNHSNPDRKPLGGQKLAIPAAALSLKTYGYCTLESDMGTGKTLIAIRAALSAGAEVILVVAPSTLLEKWVREVKITITGADAMIVKSITDLELARKRILSHQRMVRLMYPTPDKEKGQLGYPPFFVIMSKEQMKMESGWQTAVVHHPPRGDSVLLKKSLKQTHSSGHQPTTATATKVTKTFWAKKAEGGPYYPRTKSGELVRQDVFLGFTFIDNDAAESTKASSVASDQSSSDVSTDKEQVVNPPTGQGTLFPDQHNLSATTNGKGKKQRQAVSGQEPTKNNSQPAKIKIPMIAKHKLLTWPHCPRCDSPIWDNDGLPAVLAKLTDKKLTCQSCSEPLWQRRSNLLSIPGGRKRWAWENPLAVWDSSRRAFVLPSTDEVEKHQSAAIVESERLRQELLEQGTQYEEYYDAALLNQQYYPNADTSSDSSTETTNLDQTPLDAPADVPIIRPITLAEEAGRWLKTYPAPHDEAYRKLYKMSMAQDNPQADAIYATHSPDEWGEIASLLARASLIDTRIATREAAALNDSLRDDWLNFPEYRDSNPTGFRRVKLSQYVQRRMNKFFKLLIIDEVHQMKAKGSGQGISAGRLAMACKWVLTLTGTYADGYSTMVMQLLWRFTDPSIRRLWGRNDTGRWAKRYGIIKATRSGAGGGPDAVADEDFVVSDGKASDREIGGRIRFEEAPGISPEVALMTIPHTVYLGLPDVASNLPTYTEYPDASIPMRSISDGVWPENSGAKTGTPLPSQEQAYYNLAQTLIHELRVQLARGSTRLLGAMVHSLLAWLDNPTRSEVVLDPATHVLVASAPALSKDVLYPKEVKLVNLYKRVKAEGKKMLIYIAYTDSRDMAPRLQWVLKQADPTVKIAVMGKGDSSKREAWINKQVEEGCDVLITHPKNVEVGLDLLKFPVIVFYNVYYVTQTIEQAKKRAYRIGQIYPCETYFWAYGGTAQEKGLTHVARKIYAAAKLKGQIVDEGITEILGSDEEESMLKAIARAITTQDKAPLGNRAADSGASSPSATNSEEQKSQTGNDGSEAGVYDDAYVDSSMGALSLEQLMQSTLDEEMRDAAFIVGDTDASPEALEQAITTLYKRTFGSNPDDDFIEVGDGIVDPTDTSVTLTASISTKSKQPPASVSSSSPTKPRPVLLPSSPSLETFATPEQPPNMEVATGEAVNTTDLASINNADSSTNAKIHLVPAAKVGIESNSEPPVVSAPLRVSISDRIAKATTKSNPLNNSDQPPITKETLTPVNAPISLEEFRKQVLAARNNKTAKSSSGIKRKVGDSGEAELTQVSLF
jgi:tRNA1(Val) A37 N6-methylase TrmN6